MSTDGCDGGTRGPTTVSGFATLRARGLLMRLWTPASCVIVTGVLLSACAPEQAPQRGPVVMPSPAATPLAGSPLPIESPLPPRATQQGDRDGDGIADGRDRCPSEPEDFDGFQDEDGCPDPDNDHDGIPDLRDRCPNVPEDLDGVQDQDGCPEANGDDRDGDGILDATDMCPDDPEDRDGFQDADGCPDPDNDNDAILDRDDLCPNQPGPASRGGCPGR